MSNIVITIDEDAVRLILGALSQRPNQEIPELQPKELPKPVVEYVKTGDISIIQAIPNFKELYRNILFLQLHTISGRTIRGTKHSGSKYRDYAGVLPPYFNDDVVASLKKQLDQGEINVVLLDNGEKPGLVLDMLTIDHDWSALARMFNTLWRTPK